MKTHVSFQRASSDLEPDVPPLGTDIAEWLIAELRQRGVTCDEFCELDYAFTFAAVVGGFSFDTMVGHVGDGDRQWLITAETRLGIIRRLFGTSDADEHLQLLNHIDSLLQHDEATSAVRWYTADEWNRTPDTTWSEHPGSNSARGADTSVEHFRLADLQVAGEDRDDFDAESCQQLLQALINQGAKTVGEVPQLGICVTLEQFFTGNLSKHSIAANVCPAPPFDTAQSWFDHLYTVRSHHCVQDILVQIYMVEPYEDGQLRSWPYADTVWVYSTLEQSAIASLLRPLDPDEVRDASVRDSNWDLKPPGDVPAGSTPYWVWWD